MSEELSLIKANEIDLETSRADVTAAFFKGMVGVAPLVGPMLAEAMGLVIPNQKMDRLVRFARILDDRIRYVEEDVLRQKMKSEEFTDLLEDGVTQAFRAMTDDRREHIAAILKNSITNEALTHIEEKKLLSLLGELNDAEVLTLQFYSLTSEGKKTFAEQHSELFTPIKMTFGVPEENLDKGALRSSYRTKLVEVGLVEPVFKKPEKGKLPEFDDKTGQIKVTAFRATRLGKLLLRYIDEEVQADTSTRGTDPEGG